MSQVSWLAVRHTQIGAIWMDIVLVWFVDVTKPLQKNHITNFLPVWDPRTSTNLHTTHSQNTSNNTIQNVVNCESYIEIIIVNRYVLFLYLINIPIDKIIIINFFIDWKVHMKKQKQKWSRGKNAPVIKTKQVSEILAQDQYTKKLERRKWSNQLFGFYI